MKPQGHRQLDLHADTSATAIADVLGVDHRKPVICRQRFDSEIRYRLRHRGLQLFIETTDQRLLRLAAAAVNRHDLVAAGQQLQASRFVEPGARQMERRIVAGAPNAPSNR